MNKIELKSLLADRALGTPTGQIVRLLSERGSMSAAQIARLSGLAKSTVSTTLSDLRRSGVVVESIENGQARSGGCHRPSFESITSIRSSANSDSEIGRPRTRE